MGYGKANRLSTDRDRITACARRVADVLRSLPVLLQAFRRRCALVTCLATPLLESLRVDLALDQEPANLRGCAGRIGEPWQTKNKLYPFQGFIRRPVTG
jgi:hypothetical protein